MSSASQLFNYGQTFFMDPHAVGNSSIVGITSVNLFFQSRPNFNNNISGIQFPGITLYLTETVFGMPKITANTFLNVARAEWNQITTSSDATQPTNFRFANPVQIKTGFTYAFVIAYDGNEQFVPWQNRTGYILAGTNTPSPGPSNPINGQYFDFVGTGTLDQLESITNQSDYQSWWYPLTNVFLKFQINAARYYINGVPVFANNSIPSNTFVGSSALNQSWNVSTSTTTISYPADRMEVISYNRSQSTQQAFVGGQRVWQNTVFSPGGNSNFATLSCNMSNTITANAQTSNGITFSWTNIFGAYQGDKFITIFDSSGVNIRKVTSILSNTQIIVDEPTTFVNAAAKFMVSPVASIDSFNFSSPGGSKTSLMFLKGSNANATSRFTSCSIDPLGTTINAGGTSYSNSDILYVIGFEFVNNKIPALPTYSIGNHWAQANISTNTTGGIVAVNFSNVGAGFVNSSAVKLVFANAVNTNPTANTSAGSGANLTVNVGTTICTELSNNIFKSCNIINLALHYANPFWSMVVPNEIDHTIGIAMNYFANTDPSANGNIVYYVSSTPQTLQLTMNQINRFNNLNQPIPAFVSHSNEFITLQVNGATQAVNALANTSNAYVLQINVTSTSDYAAPSINTIPLIEFAQYIINNDYTGENTNYGNAYAKHITTKFTFSGNNQISRLAEDIRLYLNAYRPPNTDIQVFARIENSIDNEAFDDEDWTRLTLVDGANNFSSPTIITDYVNLGYGFQQTPNTDVTITGVITTSNNSSNLTGVNTAFTTDLANNDLIKLYDPLFPNNNLLVASVISITNSTLITIDQNLSTNSAVGIGGNALVNQNGLKIDRIRNFKNQAFNNIWSANVVRYYNSSQHIYDGYDELQLKLVFLSSDAHQIPRLNSERGIAVSA